jgi:hypothetical protein
MSEKSFCIFIRNWIFIDFCIQSLNFFHYQQSQFSSLIRKIKKSSELVLVRFICVNEVTQARYEANLYIKFISALIVIRASWISREQRRIFFEIPQKSLIKSVNFQGLSCGLYKRSVDNNTQIDGAIEFFLSNHIQFYKSSLMNHTILSARQKKIIKKF